MIKKLKNDFSLVLYTPAQSLTVYLITVSSVEKLFGFRIRIPLTYLTVPGIRNLSNKLYAPESIEWSLCLHKKYFLNIND